MNTFISLRYIILYFSIQGSASTVDVALLAEAHGLVTDMLADPNLPPHVVGGLRSLASLLAPPSQVTLNHRVQRPGGASVSLADFNSGSDNEEIPYTGEKPSALSKVSFVLVPYPSLN